MSFGQPRPSHEELQLLLRLIALKSQELAAAIERGHLLIEQIRERRAEIERLQARVNAY